MAKVKPDPRFAALEKKIEDLGKRVDEGARLYAESGSTATALTAKVDALVEDVAALKKAGPLVIQAPTPLTSAEAMVAFEAKPSAKFRVLAPFPAMDLKAGDVLEARQSFSSPVLMASMITGGLRLASA